MIKKIRFWLLQKRAKFAFRYYEWRSIKKYEKFLK